ncbi:hypothetical protein [Brevibacterium sp. VCM10]|uniref:hypothetical protein n=1 Tax=Brevibacterium sp. VCM10 TaxID=1381751 RepID=UPI00046E93E4|nr:hypothetical protein [Brevibacterium sp. VCM10]
MKKIILAPAVALAFTGLVASPVAAAESTSAQSASTQTAEQKKAEADKAKAKKKEEAKKAAAEKAEAEKKAAAEKAAAEKKAKEKAEAAKKAAAEKKADEKKKAAEDKADKKDDAEKPPKKVDPKPAPAPKDEDKDAKDDDKSEDEANPINASVQVTSGEVTAEELAEEGVTVKVTGLEKGDKVAAKSGLTGPTTTAQGSSATLKLRSAKDAESLTSGKQSLAVQVQRTNAPTATESTSFSYTPYAAPDVNPTVSLNADEFTQSEFDKNGVEVTGEGFTPGGKVTVVGGNETSPFATQEVEADDEGKVSATLKFEGDGELPAGDYSAWGVDQESETNSPAQDFTITEDSEIDPTVKVASKTISLEDFKKDGLKFSGTGFSPDGTVSVKGEAVSAQRAAATQADELRADEDGNVEGAVIAPESIEAGKYSLTFVDDESGEESDAVEITVTEDDAVDPIDASLKVDPKEITAEDLANKDKGVTVTVSGVKKGDTITDSLTGKSETADADGDYKLHLWYEGNPDNLEVGKVPFTVTIDREGTESETLNGNINVVGDDDGETEAPAEATFTVSPKTIEAADFANDKKGVTLAVENCEPGADVHFEVNPKGINVTAYENTVKADDEGNASVNVFGTSSNASAYVGAYTATATCGDDTMKDSFKVTEGANGGGSDGGDNGNAGNGGDDGSQLPRTGADLGGLTTGALLLLVGGAAIALTGRKNKFGQTPTSF